MSALTRNREAAMFMSELSRRTGVSTSALEDALSALMAVGELIVVDHPSPDICVADDMRVVALSDEAHPNPAGRAALVWDRWLRVSLLAHRCSG